MFELERELKEKSKKIKTISFHSDEANTDRYLKEYLKDLIENHFNRLPLDCLEKNLIIKRDENEAKISCKVFENIYVKHVYLQEELTEKIKDHINKTKPAVYTNPDLLLELTDGISVAYFSIELKSTKNDSIPGSSIQQINPNEWVIFVKHTKNEVEVVTGKYINSINKKLRFPDRSPRPQVSFKEMKNWNIENRFESPNKLIYIINSNDSETKQLLLEDWLNHLANQWLGIVFNKKAKKKEPWFNNCLRMFTLKLLSRYEGLTASEKKNFQEHIKAQIKD